MASSSGPISTSCDGIADRRTGDSGIEAAQELVVHRLVHDHGAERCAALAGSAEAGEQRAFDGQIEVGCRSDDQRVLATEFEARGLQMAPCQRTDLAARPPMIR